MMVCQGFPLFFTRHFRNLSGILSVCSGFLGVSAKEENNVARGKSNFDQFPEFDSILTSSSSEPNDGVHSPPILLTKKKPLKREKSRVQFFIENDPSRDANSHANRGTDHHRLEDSPSESWKSEYSGTDLRKNLILVFFFYY